MKIPGLLFLILLSRLVQSEEQSCFCSLYGSSLEDCPCSANTIQTFNDRINPDLTRLLETDYFRSASTIYTY